MSRLVETYVNHFKCKFKSLCLTLVNHSNQIEGALNITLCIGNIESKLSGVLITKEFPVGVPSNYLSNTMPTQVTESNRLYVCLLL